MALMKCKECGAQVSTKAAACPSCGAKVKGSQTTSGCAWIALIFIAIPTVAGMILSGVHSSRRAEEAALATQTHINDARAEAERLAAMTPEQRAKFEKDASARAAAAARAAARAEGLVWNYKTEDDPLGRGQIKHAFVKSLDTINLDFPYRGPQHATLVLRTHPEFGRNVIFRIERGQLLCHSYSKCQVTARFGKGQAMKFDAVESGDNDSTVIFIQNYDRFVNNLLAADKTVLEVLVYEAGNQVFTFDTSELEWK